MMIAKQVELLEPFLKSDIWTELLLPSYKNAQEQLFSQLKQNSDPNQAQHLAGQCLALDSIIGLPIALELMKQRLETAAEDDAEPK